VAYEDKRQKAVELFTRANGSASFFHAVSRVPPRNLLKWSNHFF
jgi:hypothetical protein